MPESTEVLTEKLTEKLSGRLRNLGLMLATAESCTGGMLAAAMTDLPGASDVFERGVVTYSNDAKIELLGVPADTIREHGAVSTQTAIAMVRGLIKNSRAEIALSITGVAGPGASANKPAGLVYIAYGTKDGAIECAQHNFEGDRAAVRRQSVDAALKHLIKFLDALA